PRRCPPRGTPAARQDPSGSPGRWPRSSRAAGRSGRPRTRPLWPAAASRRPTAVLARGGDAVRGDDPPGPVLARGDDPPEPPAALRAPLGYSPYHRPLAGPKARTR